ncbi:TATA box-binding protein-associated factor RNA polymerase I subunit B isoform X2 [Myotis lucifugus]|uniref:TATA box-binding protein-associated factor RNA polymerase I subunit B isoform X2 n=1 Tax=Myotis lucifugus TaxID=59463 RepID=UPI000CCC62F7|nr:TATA box-binding protein-associated factor RNA polymerase I subunit B isoform X2 [Myotis lucifugus]
MDREEAKEFRERCTQCDAVSWGLTDEGKYYCTSCHNVTERSKDVLNSEAIPNTKIQAINRGLKKRNKLEKGWDWYVCEGFQRVLYQQAEALKALGVGPELKNQVLHNFWKRYLQKSKQAYCENPVHARKRKAAVSHRQSLGQGHPGDAEVLGSPSHSDWESEPALLSDASGPFVESDGPRKPSPPSRASHSEMASICSGSLDGVEYSLRKEKGLVKMTMPATLALCGLSLLWQREALALSDLLRFVEEGHIPYVNAFERFPEEMKLYGRDKGIFAIESWPSYEDVYRQMIDVATFLDLPRFPAITEDCYLHPNILCRKYLMEVNLPDEMSDFTCQVVKMAGIGEVDFLTFDPIARKGRTVRYDVQAVAVIVIVLKLLFLLDDNVEWSLSAIAETYNEENKEDKPCFDFRKWYQVMKKSFDEKKQKWEEARAKFVWKSEKPLYHSPIDRSVVYKRREMVVNLQKQFSTLVDSTPTAPKKSPSSFQFNWTEEGTGGTCFHGHSLQGILYKKGQSVTTMNSLYWLSTQKFCKSYCKHVTTYEESNFSLTYQFIINLFSFLLRIKTYSLHEEVSLIEKRLFKTKYSAAKTKSSRSRKVRK